MSEKKIDHKRPFILTVVVRQKNVCVIIEAAEGSEFEACVDGGEWQKYYDFIHLFEEPGVYHIHFRGDLDGLKVRDKFLDNSIPSNDFDAIYTMDDYDHEKSHYDYREAVPDDYEYVFTDVVQWGDYCWKDVRGMFEDCLFINISAMDVPDLSKVQSLSRMFCNAGRFNSYIGHWDISNVTDLSEMFWGAHSFNQPLDGWDTSNVTNMHGLFWEAERFNQPIGHWDTSQVEDMSDMFSDAWAFNQPIGGWVTSRVRDMHNMFADADQFNQPLENWDVHNVRNMHAMFYNARHFNQSLGNWNTQNAEDMSFMFCDARSFNQPLTHWNTSHVVNMDYMFGRAVSFNQPVEQWDMSHVRHCMCMFAYAYDFNQSISKWNIGMKLLPINYLLRGTKAFDLPQKNKHFAYMCIDPSPLDSFSPPSGAKLTEWLCNVEEIRRWDNRVLIMNPDVVLKRYSGVY